MLLATAKAVSWQHLFILHPFVKHLKAPPALNAFQTDHLTYLANLQTYQVDHTTYIAHRILTFEGYI